MKILILAFCLISSCLFAQSQESFHVINLLGATIYSEPDFDAQIVGRIDLGKKVYVDQVLEESAAKQISPEFKLPGYWVEVMLDSSFGYIFSSDLTLKITELIMEHNDLHTASLLGKQLSKEKVSDYQANEFGTFPLIKIKTQFERALLNEEISDGCHSYEYILIGFTLSEAYHQLINLHSRKNNNQIQFPAIISREGNIWNFSDLDAIQELRLHDLGEGRFKITLISCT